MIVGIGIDLVDMREFGEQLADTASAFVHATFTAGEIGYSRQTPASDPVRHLAARYAAKEATVKALEMTCATNAVGRAVVSLRDIEVTRDEFGCPWLLLHASAHDLANRALVDRAWLSLSHDGDYAAAMVTLERIA
ncbi:holo-ACP synthase [Mycobacterium sp. Dal123C01]|uniref:holo-ACP synthase n=1 Tax=Mycobacterium sp. Dal123C01 TaxID=3457577 RepID=UPI00403E9264